MWTCDASSQPDPPVPPWQGGDGAGRFVPLRSGGAVLDGLCLFVQGGAVLDESGLFVVWRGFVSLP